MTELLRRMDSKRTTAKNTVPLPRAKAWRAYDLLLASVRYVNPHNPALGLALNDIADDIHDALDAGVAVPDRRAGRCDYDEVSGVRLTAREVRADVGDRMSRDAEGQFEKAVTASGTLKDAPPDWFSRLQFVADLTDEEVYAWSTVGGWVAIRPRGVGRE